MVHKEKFFQFVDDEWQWDREQCEAYWFKENDGCVPSEYLGEDLYNDIINKFYAPFLYIVENIEKEFKLSSMVLRICVMPCHEGESYVVIHDDEKVYLTYQCKAWQFWFGNTKEFDDFVQEQEDKIRAVLNPKLHRVS